VESCQKHEKATKKTIVGSGVGALLSDLLGGGRGTSSYVYVKLHCSSPDDDNVVVNKMRKDYALSRALSRFVAMLRFSLHIKRLQNDY
jgi:hypothetical protein